MEQATLVLFAADNDRTVLRTDGSAGLWHLTAVSATMNLVSIRGQPSSKITERL